MTLMSLFRPLTPREMARWTLRIYLQNPGQWIALALLAVIPLLIVNYAFLLALPQPAFDAALLDQFLSPLENGEMLNDPALQQQLMENMLQNSFVMLQQVVAQMAAQIVILGTLAGGIGSLMASAAYHGEPVALGTALSGFGLRARRLLTGHVVAAVILVLLLVASILGTAICIGVLGLGLTIFTYLALVPLAAPALALGEGSASALLRRAWVFGKARVWPILTATVALYILRVVAGFPLDLLQSVLAPGSILAGQVITILIELVALPLGVIYFTLLYEDSRGREALAVANDTLTTPGPGPARAGLLTAADLPSVIGVSMVAMGLLFGFYLLLMLRTMLALGG